MRSPSMTAFICAMFFIVDMSGAQENGIMRDGAYYVEETAHSYQVDPTGTLTADTGFGSIEISGWAKDEVNVTVEKRLESDSEDRSRRAFEEIEVKTEIREDGVHISVDRPHSLRRNGVSVDIAVQVPENYSLDLKTSGGDINVEDLGGDVRARTSGGDVDIGNIRDAVVDVRTSGGDIQLESAGGDTRMETSGGDIQVENAYGRTDVQTSGGDIQVENAKGELTATSSGGDMQIEHSMGSLTLRTSGGDIQIEHAMAGVRAESSGGDIAIENARGTVDVSSKGGDIDIENADGGVTATTTGGEINVGLTGTESSTDRSCYLKSKGGDVTIYLPEDLAATIDAEIHVVKTGFWGDVSNRIYSAFDLSGNKGGGHTKSRTGIYGGTGSGRASAAGDINGGGDLIRLETSNGDINIRKRSR